MAQSLAALPPLPASAFAGSSSSNSSSSRRGVDLSPAALDALYVRFGSMSNPLDAVLDRVWDQLLLEITTDVCVKVHRDAQARIGNAAPLLDVDVFGAVITKKNPEKSFKCESCGQKTGSSKFAAHLEKCTGKGGRTSRRAKHPSNVAAAAAAAAATAAANAAVAAAASAAAQQAASAGAPSIAALNHREDDVELIEATSRGAGKFGGMMPSSRASPASALMRQLGPSPIAGLSRGSSPIRGGDRSVTPLGLGLGSGSAVGAQGHGQTVSPFLHLQHDQGGSSSPFGSAAAGTVSPATLMSDSHNWGSAELDANLVQPVPSGSGSTTLAGHKRSRASASPSSLADDSSTPTSLPPPKAARRHSPEEFWTDVLPSPLPTQAAGASQALMALGLGAAAGASSGSTAGSAAAGGGVPLPFFILSGDLASLGAATVPSPAAVSEMLGRICGAPSAVTGKLCSNKPSCSMHLEADRARVRLAIQTGEGAIRFKRVRPAASSSATAANQGSGGGPTGSAAGAKKRGAAATAAALLVSDST